MSIERCSRVECTLDKASVQLSAPGVATISCSTWGLGGQRNSKSWLLLTRVSRPTRTEALHENPGLRVIPAAVHSLQRQLPRTVAASTVMRSPLQRCSLPLMSVTPARQEICCFTTSPVCPIGMQFLFDSRTELLLLSLTRSADIQQVFQYQIASKPDYYTMSRSGDAPLKNRKLITDILYFDTCC